MHLNTLECFACRRPLCCCVLRSKILPWFFSRHNLLHCSAGGLYMVRSIAKRALWGSIALTVV